MSQVIGCEDRLRNDLYCVEWGVKLYSNQRSVPHSYASGRAVDNVRTSDGLGPVGIVVELSGGGA